MVSYKKICKGLNIIYFKIRLEKFVFSRHPEQFTVGGYSYYRLDFLHLNFLILIIPSQYQNYMTTRFGADFTCALLFCGFQSRVVCIIHLIVLF